MNLEPSKLSSSVEMVPPTAAPVKPFRLRVPVTLVAIYWAANLVAGRIDKPYFMGFLFQMASALLLALVLFGWWLSRRRVPFFDRLWTILAIVGAGVAVAPLVDRSFNWMGLMMAGLPLVLTVWTIWMVLVRWTSFSWSRAGLLVVVASTWGLFTLIRMDGADAELRATISWRWRRPPRNCSWPIKRGPGWRSRPAVPTGSRRWRPAPGTGFVDRIARACSTA